MSTEFRLYAHNLPTEKSYVNFEFTERQEHSLACRLIDYNINASMPLKFLTRKKKIKSFNKMTPLNKPMIGWVEEINNDDILISIAYVEYESESYLNFKEESNNNKVLKNIFKRYCYKNNQNLVNIWNKYIHPLDLTRVENSELSLYEYFCENYLDLEMDSMLVEFVKEELLNKDSEKLETSNFKLVSITGIDKVKSLLNDTLKEMDLDCDIYLDQCPEYYIKSRNIKIKKEEHQLFFSNLDSNIKKNNLQIFLSY